MNLVNKKNNKFSKLLINYLILVSSHCLTLGDNYVRPMANTRLCGHTYSTLERWTIVYCLMECSNNEKCASFNYNQAEEICEVNGFVDLVGNKGGVKLQSQTGWTFYKKNVNVRKDFFLTTHNIKDY